MLRGGGKREDTVKRRGRVRQLQIAIDKQFKVLMECDDVYLDADSVARCSDSTRELQSKHEFMAFPERMDIIHDYRDTLRHKKQASLELRQSIAEQEADLLKRQSFAIAEFTDVTKATKIAQKLFELYTTEWMNLWEVTREKLPVKQPDAVITGGVKDIIELCYVTCREISKEQRKRINDILYFNVTDTTMAPPLELRIRECQLNTSPYSLSHLYKIIKLYIADNNSELMKRLKVSPYKTPLAEFLERCIELTWYSQIREPPLVMEFSVLEDQSVYAPFGTRGPTIDHIVWPVLFLHEDGPVLAKGVAKFNAEI